MGITAAVIGIGFSAVGAVTSYEGQKKAASAQQDMIRQEQQAEAVRKQAMEVDARRKSLEDLRQGQRARAMALSNATSQGASLGSGLQGGYGQISGQLNTGLLGIQNQLGFGNQLFGINQQISNSKIAMSQGQSLAATGGGLSSLGGAFLTSASNINAIGKSFSTSNGYTGWGSGVFNRSGAS